MIFRNNEILGYLAENKRIWENLSFYSMCALNVIIIFSYSQKFMPDDIPPDDSTYDFILTEQRNYNPRLLYQEQFTWTDSLITLLGLSLLALESLVVFFFFLKKAPLMVRDMWAEWFQLNTNRISKAVQMLFVLFKSFLVWLSDFDFVYNVCYMTIVVLGLSFHPFFFGILSLDFMRQPMLRNVVAAIWQPRNILAITFLMFLFIQYFFVLYAYIELSD